MRRFTLALVIVVLAGCGGAGAPTAAPETAGFDIRAVRGSFSADCNAADRGVLDAAFCDQVDIDGMTADGATLSVPTYLAASENARGEEICALIALAHYDANAADLGYEVIGILDNGGGNLAACTVAPEGASGPTAAPVMETPALALPSKYAELTSRNWKRLVKSPDRYIGKGYRLWACIFQFDAATGEDGFLANASYRKERYWGLDGENAAFTGDAATLADFVEGDIVLINAVAMGSYSYDTQAGGNTTVPSFHVARIRRQKGSCQ